MFPGIFTLNRLRQLHETWSNETLDRPDHEDIYN